MTKRSLLFCLGLFAITACAYLPVRNAGFIWDDAAHVTAPALRSLEGLGRIWFEVGATQQYYPLLHSMFWLEYRLWGAAPLGYHLVNLGWHATAACLFMFVLGRLGVAGAFAAAAVFAVHPVHVESVAWISEQKNTLSLVFYLGAVLAYLRFDAERARSWYAVAFLLFVFALLSKSVTATLPAALLVLFWWQRGSFSWRRDVLPLVPWFALAMLAGAVTVLIERKIIGAEGAAYDLSISDRGVLAGRAFWFYLEKLLWPADVAFFYPRWTIDSSDARQWLPLAAVLGLVGVLWFLRNRSRAPLAAVLTFGGSLLPALGFFNVYPFRYSFVADHLQYLPSLAVIALVVSGSARAFALRDHPRAGGAVAATVIVTLGALTWRQCAIYHDAGTLYRATIQRNPGSWIAHNNLGREIMSDPQRTDEALASFREAIRLWPDYYEAHNNLGLLLSQTGRHEEAIPYLETAARLQPDAYQVHNNLGIALAGSGRTDEAIVAFQHAVDLNPRLANLHENLAKALRLAGRASEAHGHFAEAARLRGQTPTTGGR